MDLTFPLVVAIVVVLALWAGNYAGVEMTMRFAYVTGGLLLIPLVVFVVLPYVSGDWSASNLSWNLDGAGGGWLQNALVWLYIMAWTSFGVEVCATFTPEYRDGARDAWKALPIMNTGMADGSRALYGMSAEGVTIRQVGLLNRRGVPGRALALALVVNIAVLIFVSNPLAIIVTGNLGYLVAHFFALTGFILLRRDKPSLARPIRLPNVFIPIAAVFAAFLAVVIVVGATSFSITGYGGTKELLIALGLLASSVALYAYRRKVQDGGRLSLREPGREETAGATVPS